LKGFTQRETDIEDAHHRTVRNKTSDYPGWHASRRLRRAGSRCVECRRARHHHRSDAADTRGSGARNRPLPRHDRPALRRQSDLSVVIRGAALPGIHPRDRRGRGADRRNRRPQPGAIHPGLEGARRQGHPQMHLGAPFADRRTDRLRCDQRRRVRVRRPSGRR